jgi:hypothetical protein
MVMKASARWPIVDDGAADQMRFGKHGFAARLGGIDAKTLSFFNASHTRSIDFCQFDPMFALNAALDRNAIPEG